MSYSNNVKIAADRLIQARLDGRPCEPIRDLIGADNVFEAYEIQRYIIEDRLNKGAECIGAKIGLTSEAIQAQLGVDQADFGLLFDDMKIENGSTFSYSKLMQPKIETEVAFVLGKDLSAKVPTERELMESIDHIRVSMEIVGSRIANWDIKIADTIADNASSSHFVLGNTCVPIEGFDFTGCEMTMKKNGEVISSGLGKDCLGSPMNALLWLAIKYAHLGNPLKKGDIILSGALGPMATISPNDFFEGEISALGSVSLSFSA